MDYIEKILLADDRWKGLPIFLWSESMGGATALTMARKNPNAFAGLVLYAPMISLEIVRQQVRARTPPAWDVCACDCDVTMLVDVRTGRGIWYQKRAPRRYAER